MALFNRMPKLPPVENYPGYEETEFAFANAASIVLKVMKNLREEKEVWYKKAWVELDDFVKNNHKKLPDEEVDIQIKAKELLWDNFRNVLMKSENNGAWNKETSSEITRIFFEVFASLPAKHRVNGTQYIEAVRLLILSLDEAINEDKQILAQPIIEFVVILWLHYCRISREGNLL